MGLNRNFAYLLRKYMPDIQIMHNALANHKLSAYRNLLLPEDVVLQGENDPSKISEIIEKCSYTRSKQINGLVTFFNKYLETWNIVLEKDLYEKTKTQMLFDCMAYGFSPDEFNYYDLMHKTPAQKRKYSTDLDRKMMQYQLSDFKDLQYVFDKAATYDMFSEYYKRDAISVASKKDYKKFKRFAEKHDKMIIKKVSDSCGHGITIEEIDKNNTRAQFESIISQGRCSIEELINQSDILGEFNSSSVNTARIITFNTNHGIVVGPCFFRTGKAGSFVDNGGSGGIMIALDVKSGKLNSDGYDEYPKAYKVHPNSKKKFNGFQLPEWDKCIDIVTEMANKLPRVGYIGWDMAYDRKKGWVIVEANGGSHIMTQIMYGKGCKPEIESYMNDMRRYGR